MRTNKTAWRILCAMLNGTSDLVFGLCMVAGTAIAGGGSFPGVPGSDPWEHRPNDPQYEEHWHIFSHMPPGFDGPISDRERAWGSGMHVDRAWQLHTGRSDLLIAILDSGIMWDTIDLVDRHFINRREIPMPEGADRYDANGDGRFSVSDYAHDNRVYDANENGLIDVGDLIRIFSDGVDDDANGYVDDIGGWDFHEHDNDPYDRVRFGHGTGEAKDSVAAINNGNGGAGICGDCSFVALRVNDSFVIDVNAFAEAIIYATDLGADLVQQALGSANNNPYVEQAINYAYDQGMIIIGSAADENSYHHNYPSTLDPIIYTNAIRYDTREPGQASTFVAFNNCSNYGARVDVATSGLSCSSEATGNLSGVTGLTLSYAKELGVAVGPGEMTSLLKTTATDIALGEAAADSFRHSTWSGWDTMTGYGRPHALMLLESIRDGNIPPEVRIVSPQWFAVERLSHDGELQIDGQVRAHGGDGLLHVEVWAYRGVETSSSEGILLASFQVDGAWKAPMARVRHTDLAQLRLGAEDVSRNTFAYTFVMKATDQSGRSAESRRTVFLVEDDRLLADFPRKLKGSGEASGLFFDLDGDGKDEYLLGDGAGMVHAFRSDATQLPGFPAPTARSRYDRSGSGSFEPAYSSLYAPIAVGDVDGEPGVEIVAASMEGQISVLNARGEQLPGYPVAIPLPDMTLVEPGQVIAQGIWAAPVLVNLDADEALEIVVPALDGRLYVFDQGGVDLPGFPLTVDLDGNLAKLLSSPAVADVNGDGTPDLIMGSNHTGAAAGSLFAIDGRGTRAGRAMLEGFPAKVPLIRDMVLPTVGTGVPTSPVVADFDGDGQAEIMVHAFVGKSYLFGFDGRPKKSLSIRVGAGHETNDEYMLSAFGHPAVGDVNGDGQLNPISVGVGKRMLVNMLLGGKKFPYDHMVGAWDAVSGQMLTGFPRRHDDMQLTGTPVTIDLDGDGAEEVLAGSGGYWLRSFDSREPERSQRYFTGGWIFGAPSVGDMDGDGKMEIAVTTREGYLFVWRTEAERTHRMSWPTFKGGATRTGHYQGGR